MNTDAPVSNTALILLEGRNDILNVSDLATHKVPAPDLVTVVTLRDLTHPDQPVTLGEQDQGDIVIRVDPRTSPPPVPVTRLVVLEGIGDWTTRETRDPDRVTEVRLMDVTDPTQPIIMDMSRKTGNQFEIKYAHCQVRPGHVYQLSGTTYQQDKITHIGSMGITLDGNGHKGLSIEFRKLVDRDLTPRGR